MSTAVQQLPENLLNRVYALLPEYRLDQFNALVTSTWQGKLVYKFESFVCYNSQQFALFPLGVTLIATGVKAFLASIRLIQSLGTFLRGGRPFQWPIIHLRGLAKLFVVSGVFYACVMGIVSGIEGLATRKIIPSAFAAICRLERYQRELRDILQKNTRASLEREAVENYHPTLLKLKNLDRMRRAFEEQMSHFTFSGIDRLPVYDGMGTA